MPVGKAVTAMQRVIIMGPPGSGKSTLARRIGTQHGLPVFHLDRAYWQPGWTMTPAADFAFAVGRVASGPAWVIDGNNTATLWPRLCAADTVILLDVPAWLSMLRIARRTLANYGRVRPDVAPRCPEKLDLAFLRFAWAWNRTRRDQTLAALEGFDGRMIVLRGRSASGSTLPE